MEAVSLSNRALLTEVIPTAWSGREEGEEASEGKRDSCREHTHTSTHAHTHSNTHTMSLSVLGCDRPMALARYVNYVCRAIHHPCTFSPETGTFVWSIHLLSPSFDAAWPNLFPYSPDRGFISTYVLFFRFPLSLWSCTVQTRRWKRGHVVTEERLRATVWGRHWPLSSVTRVGK